MCVYKYEARHLNVQAYQLSPIPPSLDRVVLAATAAAVVVEQTFVSVRAIFCSFSRKKS